MCIEKYSGGSSTYCTSAGLSPCEQPPGFQNSSQGARQLDLPPLPSSDLPFPLDEAFPLLAFMYSSYVECFNAAGACDNLGNLILFLVQLELDKEFCKHGVDPI